MSCPIMKARYDPIPDELLDKSLKWYPNHTVFTHLGCVLIRVVLGLLLIYSQKSTKLRTGLIITMALGMLSFGSKYIQNALIKDVVYWKSYPRMLVAYSAALSLIVMKENKLAGALVIADALMGMNSRHTASVVTCGVKK